MYVMTPIDHRSHDVSYASGPRTSGAVMDKEYNYINAVIHTCTRLVSLEMGAY